MKKFQLERHFVAAVLVLAPLYTTSIGDRVQASHCFTELPVPQVGLACGTFGRHWTEARDGQSYGSPWVLYALSPEAVFAVPAFS